VRNSGAGRTGSSHFFCNAAQSFGKERETVCVSGLPRTTATNPKQEKENRNMTTLESRQSISRPPLRRAFVLTSIFLRSTGGQTKMQRISCLTISVIFVVAFGTMLGPTAKAQSVNLQATTPGSQQTGNTNISGTMLARKIGLGTNSPLQRLTVVETGANGAASFSALNNAVIARSTTTNGAFGAGIFTTNSTAGTGVLGRASATTGATFGVFGSVSSPSGTAVEGIASSTGTGTSFGGDFSTASSTGNAVRARATHTTGRNFAGVFDTSSINGTAIIARATSTANTSLGIGVDGQTFSTHSGDFIGVGVLGQTMRSAGIADGVVGKAIGANQIGVFGVNTATNGDSVGGFFLTNSAAGTALFSGGNFVGSGAKNFVIDHPLDPQNWSLYHSCTEGPEPYNVYRGMVKLDARGEGWVELPNYFEAINANPSYQLTPVGAAMPSLHVAVKITRNRFRVAGGVAGREVSWQVMGTRNDPGFALRGYQTIKPKTGAQSGKYWFPEAYGWTPEQGIGYQSLASAEIQTPESDVASPDQPEN
jgi:hypothetical protein